MRKISKEELRHGTWFRKMMVVTVFLFIAMIAAGAAMQMAEWALSGGNGLAAWLVVFGIFAAAVAGCKAYWKPIVRYCRRKYLTVPVVSGLLDGKEIDRLLDGEVFETVVDLDRNWDVKESANWFRVADYYISKQLTMGMQLGNNVGVVNTGRETGELSLLGIDGTFLKVTLPTMIPRSGVEQIYHYIRSEGSIRTNWVWKIFDCGEETRHPVLQRVFEEECRKFPSKTEAVLALGADAEELKEREIAALSYEEKEGVYRFQKEAMKLVRTVKIGNAKKNGFVEQYDRAYAFEICSKALKALIVKEPGKKERKFEIEDWPFLYMTQRVPEWYEILDEQGNVVFGKK